MKGRKILKELRSLLDEMESSKVTLIGDIMLIDIIMAIQTD